jgi:hypothetical protein
VIVSIHQPAYLPWPGYLARIAASELFVFLDTVQFEKRSFINRNRIKTGNGSLWLTVPVRARGHRDKTLMEIEVDNEQGWSRKHLRAIERCYRRAPYFGLNFDRLAAILTPPQDRLVELCFRQLHFWLDEFGIRTPVVRSSDLRVTGRKSELMLNLCRHTGATTYLSGPLGRGYIQEERFAASGIAVEFHRYVPPEYPQLHGAFIPALSTVDFWMNCGNAEVVAHLDGLSSPPAGGQRVSWSGV